MNKNNAPALIYLCTLTNDARQLTIKFAISISQFSSRYGLRLLAGIVSTVILASIITTASIIGDENLDPIYPNPIR